MPMLLMATGCTSFSHDWKQAGRSATNELPATATLEGRWQGTWASDVNHHTDPLKCVITKKPDGTYRARFYAKYHHVLGFDYTVPLKAEPGTNGLNFSGKANLGWLAGGIYTYAGHANATNFFSTYACKYDHGIFQMIRP